MVDDQDLAGLDPYDLMATEAARLDAYLAHASADDWNKPTRCEGWNARGLLAHLAASEDYNQACLDGTVQEFLADIGAKGAVDLASANEIGIREFDDQTPEQILDTWRAPECAEPRRLPGPRRRRRRQQRRRVSRTLAGVPPRVRARDPRRRRRGSGHRGRGARSHRVAGALRPLRAQGVEARVDLESSGDRTHVKGEGVDIELPDEQFVQAVAARLPADSGIDAETAASVGDAVTLRDARILVTGATGQVALPVALGLAADNHVVALARFKDAAARERLEAAGVECISVDLAKGVFDGVPTDVDYVCNFAVVKSNKWEVDLAGNAEAAGLLMAHCRNARAFLHCSSTGVYEAADGSPQRETDPLGDNHRVMMPTYSIAKIAAEAVVRTTCRIFDVPTTIARLNVPYGDGGGWPAFHLALMQAGHAVPVHPTDRAGSIRSTTTTSSRRCRACSAAASVPATIVNWGGDDETSIEGWCEYMGELVGVEARFETHDRHDRRHPDRQHQAARARRAHEGRLEGRHAPDGRGSGVRFGFGRRGGRVVPPVRQYSPCARDKKSSSTR